MYAKERTFHAPGRVNLIGEHIDYNGGLVMPAALSLGITARFVPRSDFKITMRSDGHALQREVDIDDEWAFDASSGWTNYPVAVISELKKLDVSLSGFDIEYSSTLPEGSGLSSSAAIEAVTAFGLLKCNGEKVNRTWLAQLCREAEAEFIGVQCGIMDQFAVCNGHADHALLLNCATLAYEPVPLQLGAYRLLVMNTNKPRQLAQSAYNQRRQECRDALGKMQAWKPALQHLCDAVVTDVESLVDPVLKKRARHAVTEQWRVREAARVLAMGDLHTFGRLLNASHASLKNDYEVTGTELDALVMSAQNIKGCLGARMTGAGFGGCAIALVHDSAIPLFTETVAKQYERATGLHPTFYDCTITDGVREICN